MKTIVSDASPLIILAKIDLINILPKVYSKVFVPEAVINEILNGPSDDPIRIQIKSLAWIEPVKLSPPLAPLTCWHLGQGESEVIEFAKQQPDAIALLDDLAARRFAISLSIPVIGTLSLAMQSVFFDDTLTIDTICKRLKHAGLYVNDQVILSVKKTLNLE